MKHMSQRFVASVQSRLVAVRSDDEQGAVAAEYGLLVALVAIGIIAGATALGADLSNKFDAVGQKIADVVIP